jgi:NAD(P)-dependent dehydrogenase (short-subunit alcohol dehydrogenase family)
MKSHINDDLRDRVALVSGATGGMGSAICARLLDDGMRVVMLGRDAARSPTPSSPSTARSTAPLPASPRRSRATLGSTGYESTW